MELEEHQMKKYNWEQDQIKHMKVSIRIMIYVYGSLDICIVCTCI